MDIYVIESFLLADIDDGHQVVDMAVYAPIADQTQQMQGFALGPGATDGVQQYLVFGKRAVPDAYVDTLQLLIDDPAGTEVQVSYFRIAHLAFRQAYCFSAGDQRCIGILLIK